MKTDDKTLIEALLILARDIQSDDGVANACIYEAAVRLRELTNCQPVDIESVENSFLEYYSKLENKPVSCNGLVTCFLTWASSIGMLNTGWQPIETAPNDVELLLYSPSLNNFSREEIEVSVFRCERGGWEKSGVTHWMPLPNPPRE